MIGCLCGGVLEFLLALLAAACVWTLRRIGVLPRREKRRVRQ